MSKRSGTIFSVLFLAAAALLIGLPVSAEENHSTERDDDHGRSCRAIAVINPGEQNIPEVSVVDGVGVQATVQLNGASSKPSNAYSMLWEQTGGPAVVLKGKKDDKQVTFLAPQVGPEGATLTFRLTVQGCSPLQTSVATAIVKITGANRSPVAIILPEGDVTVTEGAWVSFDGSLSKDPDGDNLSYSWSQVVNGEHGEVLSADKVFTFTAPVAPYPDGASLAFRLTVSDGYLISSADKTVNVKWVNAPPLAKLSCPVQAGEGDLITLDGSASSDTDNGIVSYAWKQLLGVPNAELPSDLTTPSISFRVPLLGPAYDTMKFGLAVTDSGGLSSSAECDVRVVDVTPPVIGMIDTISVEAKSRVGSNVIYKLTAIDAVDGDVAVLCNPASGSGFALGDTVVNCSAKDKAGNAAAHSFIVKVLDTKAPTVLPPPNVRLYATGSLTAVKFRAALAKDAIGVVSLKSDAPAGGFPVGTTTVTWSARDAAGNTGVAKSTVTVLPWTMKGFYMPVRMGGIVNKVKGGSTVPIRFEMFSGPTELTKVSAIKQISADPVTCTNTSGPTNEINDSELDLSPASLTYDSKSGRYVYKWRTPDEKGTCYVVTLTGQDGSKLSANFKLR